MALLHGTGDGPFNFEKSSMTFDPVDNRIRIDPRTMPEVEAYRQRYRLATKTDAANSLIIRGLEAERKEKPHTTRNGR